MSRERLLGMRILIVEDSEDLREMLWLYLTGSGARVEFACDGEAAVRAALEGQYDVVVMDLQIPMVDGFEATTRLRCAGYLQPIIAMSACVMVEDRERSHQAGFDAHFGKPINRKDFLEAIARYCPVPPARMTGRCGSGQ